MIDTWPLATIKVDALPGQFTSLLSTMAVGRNDLS